MSSGAAAKTHVWRALGTPVDLEDPPKGLDKLWSTAHGVVKRRLLSPRTFLNRAAGVLRLEGEYSRLSDKRLALEAEKLREALRRGRETEAEIARAGAVVREAALRVFGFRHHEEQVAGALAMHSGCVAEMATGEGKTLTATIPAVLAAWRGKGCHVLTVNDYLAARDSDEMGKLYSYFGLRSRAITQDTAPGERAAAYAADITYLTNKEAAADYLRDRLALGGDRSLCGYLLSEIFGCARTGESGIVQRGLEYAIVDEADSVLIDEAVTPLIISADGGGAERMESFAIGRTVADALVENVDYTIDWGFKEIAFTAEGRRRIERLTGEYGGLWKGARQREEVIMQALSAERFFLRDREYIVDDGKVVIVDESTGRLMPDRSWREGLHQAVEAKERVEVTPPKTTLARISFQRFFRLYNKLSGMSGTAREALGELWHIYRLPVVPIPTHRPCRRVMLRPRVFSRQEDKWAAVVGEIARVHSRGRPILVGTRSIQASEHLSSLLRAAGIDHQVLNAVHHRREAEIVAQAGKKGAVTVATNMAGRGTDIKLTKESEALGGLHIVATERHLSFRIDRQLYGRCSRQGDPGSAVAFLSLTDELPKRFCPMVSTALRRFFPVVRSTRLLTLPFVLAEKRAERQAFKQRQGVLASDTWLGEQLGFAGKEP